MVSLLDYLWLIPLLPLLGAAWSGFVRVKPGLVSTGAVLASFLLSIGAVLELARTPESIHQSIHFTWLAGMPFRMADGRMAVFSADWGFLLDPLSALMILVVTGIGFLIHVYSTGYMARDEGYARFFAYLNLFVFFMLMLVLANNYALMFVGWEGVGLCSYLLIGFYFQKRAAGDAGKKAFIMNRVGDAGFLLGIFLIFSLIGSIRFLDVTEDLTSGRFAAETGFGVLSIAALLLFLGAAGKSAQFPLYTWLPDAMEGPTPVSALIHAATMVTAGVYMVARSSALFVLAPEASGVIAVVGALTAVLAASVALVQTDIKRVLAYSTVSQLGYMFVACGVGAYWVAIFHLFTHAFFKALLFLGAGSVIHALGGEQDMRRMGGLKDKIPVTFRTMWIASLAIAGVPGLAGFFSKDEILWQAWSSPLGSKTLYAVGLATAFLTAVYMWRLMYLTFYGPSRVEPETAAHIHEAPLSMTAPLAVLAAGSIAAGWIGLEHWLSPALVQSAAHHGSTALYVLMALAAAVAIGGILLARRFYLTHPKSSARWTGGPLHRVLENKWYLDELCDFLFVNGLTKTGGRLLGLFDRRILDGGVNGAGWLARFVSTVSIWWDTWIVDGLVRLTAFSAKLSSYPARIIQTGQMQAYALAFVLSLAIFLGYFLVR
ncbi:MAG: NADH-quinone oxidoreductase subunit L [Bryobacteraceae bacterium]